MDSPSDGLGSATAASTTEDTIHGSTVEHETSVGTATSTSDSTGSSSSDSTTSGDSTTSADSTGSDTWSDECGEEGLEVVLTWDSDADVDLHVVRRDGGPTDLLCDWSWDCHAGQAHWCARTSTTNEEAAIVDPATPGTYGVLVHVATLPPGASGVDVTLSVSINGSVVRVYERTLDNVHDVWLSSTVEFYLDYVNCGDEWPFCDSTNGYLANMPEMAECGAQTFPVPWGALCRPGSL